MNTAFEERRRTRRDAAAKATAANAAANAAAVAAAATTTTTTDAVAPTSEIDVNDDDNDEFMATLNVVDAHERAVGAVVALSVRYLVLTIQINNNLTCTIMST